MVERKDLKAGARYNYQDKGIPGPVVVVVEKIEGGMVTAREEESQAAQTWVIDTFCDHATAVVRLNLPLGS